MTRIGVRAFTDVGLRRKRNEDAVLVGGWISQSHDGTLTAMEFEPTFPFVCAVADGMGGHKGGNIASKLALTAIAERSPAWRTVEDVATTMTHVNEEVREVGAESELYGLGTTVAGLCLTPTEIIVFNVGDSRVYSISGGLPHQLSHDDSVLDAKGNPTNVITQSLGQQGPVQTHVTTLPLRSGTYLMCSDGVTGMVSDTDLRAAAGLADVSDGAAELIRMTRANGAEDNFSFVIVVVPDLESSDTEPVEAEYQSAPSRPRGAQRPPLPPPPGGQAFHNTVGFVTPPLPQRMPPPPAPPQRPHPSSGPPMPPPMPPPRPPYGRTR